MASESPSKRLRLEVTCPICLDYILDLVILDCGHSFCQACVARYWEDAGAGMACPQCRMAVGQNFRLNRLLTNTVEVHQQMSWLATKEAQGQRGNCERHHLPLEFFCKDDGVPFCLRCYRAKYHVGHQVVPLGEAAQEYKAKHMKAKKRKHSKQQKKKQKQSVEVPWWSAEGNRSGVAPILEQVVEEVQYEKADLNCPADKPSGPARDGFAVHKRNEKRAEPFHNTGDKVLEGEGPSTLLNVNSGYDVCQMEENPKLGPDDNEVEEGGVILHPPGSMGIHHSLPDLPGSVEDIGIHRSLLDLPGRVEDASSLANQPLGSTLGSILAEQAGEPVQNHLKECPDSQQFLPDGLLLPVNCTPPRKPSASKSNRRGSRRDLYQRRTSYVWTYFSHVDDNKLVVMCHVCQCKVRLGREGGCQRVGTSSMRKHIESRHPQLVPKSDPTAASTPKRPGRARSTKKPKESLGGQGCLQNWVVPRKQMKIPKTWVRQEKCERDDVKAVKLNRALGFFVVSSMLPLSIVEDEAFLELAQELDPHWEVPRPLRLSTEVLPALAKDIKRELLKALRNSAADAVHLTSAIWTSNQTKAYLCVAAHWVSVDEERIERKKALLAVKLLSNSHHAQSIACQLKSVVSEWLAPFTLEVGCISTDNSLDILTAVQQSGMNHVLCVTRCLNLVLRQALRTASPGVKQILNLARVVSVHFRQSLDAMDAIRVIQRRHVLPERSFTLDTDSCWKSTLHMLARLCEQKLAVNVYMEDRGDLLGFSVEPDQWSTMQDLVNLLKFFSEFIAFFNLECATFGKVLPMLQFLEVSITASGAEMARRAGSMVKNLNPSIGFAHHLLAQLRSSEHLAAIRQDMKYLAATFLEPQIQCSIRARLVNSVDHQFSMLRDYILQRCLRYEKNHSSSARQETAEAASQTEMAAPIKPEKVNGRNCKAKSRRSKWHLDFGMGTESGNSSCSPASVVQQHDAYSLVQRDLEAYIQESFSGEISCPENDPLLYWKGKISVWPSLARVAVWHLSCPPSSVASNCAFSATRNVVKLKPSLTPQNVSIMAFIRANKAWILKQGISPPTNHEGNLTPDVCGDDDEESEEEMTLLQEDMEGDDERDEV